MAVAPSYDPVSSAVAKKVLHKVGFDLSSKLFDKIFGGSKRKRPLKINDFNKISNFARRYGDKLKRATINYKITKEVSPLNQDVIFNRKHSPALYIEGQRYVDLPVIHVATGILPAVGPMQAERVLSIAKAVQANELWHYPQYTLWFGLTHGYISEDDYKRAMADLNFKKPKQPKVVVDEKGKPLPEKKITKEVTPSEEGKPETSKPAIDSTEFEKALDPKAGTETPTKPGPTGGPSPQPTPEPTSEEPPPSLPGPSPTTKPKKTETPKPPTGGGPSPSPGSSKPPTSKPPSGGTKAPSGGKVSLPSTIGSWLGLAYAIWALGEPIWDTFFSDIPYPSSQEDIDPTMTRALETAVASSHIDWTRLYQLDAEFADSLLSWQQPESLITNVLYETGIDTPVNRVLYGQETFVNEDGLLSSRPRVAEQPYTPYYEL